MRNTVAKFFEPPPSVSNLLCQKCALQVSVRKWHLPAYFFHPRRVAERRCHTQVATRCKAACYTVVFERLHRPAGVMRRIENRMGDFIF